MTREARWSIMSRLCRLQGLFGPANKGQTMKGTLGFLVGACAIGQSLLVSASLSDTDTSARLEEKRAAEQEAALRWAAALDAGDQNEKDSRTALGGANGVSLAGEIINARKR